MYVYVIYSQKLDRFYIGQTELSPEKRLEEHNASRNEGSFTTRGLPWMLFLAIKCTSRKQARKIEIHIKRMKSKKYILDLKQYPEMSIKLLERFSDPSVHTLD